MSWTAGTLLLNPGNSRLLQAQAKASTLGNVLLLAKGETIIISGRNIVGYKAAGLRLVHF